MPEPCVTYAHLHDAMRAAGVEVRVARGAEDALALSLVDFGRCRSVAVPVPARGFDAAATALCCSLALAAMVPGFDARLATETLNKWIAHELAKAGREITAAIETYRFNEAAGAAYRFVWNVYCDWYLELVKPVLMGPDGAAKTETRAMVAWVRDEILKLLHPFMPFITEELWTVTARRGNLLVLDAWPGYEGLDTMQQRHGEWVLDAYLPEPGTPTQPVEAGYMANAWVRMRHPDYDRVREMLDEVGRTVHVRAT